MPRNGRGGGPDGGGAVRGGHLHNRWAKTIIASGSVATMIPLLENHQLLVAPPPIGTMPFLMAILSLMSPRRPTSAVSC